MVNLINRIINGELSLPHIESTNARDAAVEIAKQCFESLCNINITWNGIEKKFVISVPPLASVTIITAIALIILFAPITIILGLIGLGIVGAYSDLISLELFADIKQRTQPT